MSSYTHIEWTDATWNPCTGCNKVSPGCKNCYAKRLAKRLQAMGQNKYRNAFRLTLHYDELYRPLQWKKLKNIFVNSMSDLLHEEVPFDFIQKVFAVMIRANWHRFQILTKRSERLLQLNKKLLWAPHIWMGVSVENEKYQFRIDHLCETDAHIKFLSLEPLLGPLHHLDSTGIDWIIVGGESGPDARPMKAKWVREIRDQCIAAKVPFFFKQWGGFNKKKTGRILDGRTWDEMPA